MSQFENIFKVNGDGSLSLNKEELRGNDIFKKFIGNKKENMQDMMFIYLMGDPRSMYAHLNTTDKIDRIRKHINRPIDWTPSAGLRGAAEEYKELVGLTPTGKSFLAANRSLYEDGSDINDIVEANSYLKSLLKSKLTVLESDALGADETIIMAKECRALMTEVMKNQEKANSIIKDLPILIKTVENLATSWANEGNGTKEIYGGGQLNNRE